jgi:DUF3073 family protein
MGRGRAKAKQTKVARELKYQSPDMNLDRLRQDLGASGSPSPVEEFDAVEELDDDPYAIDDDGESASRRR